MKKYNVEDLIWLNSLNDGGVLKEKGFIMDGTKTIHYVYLVDNVEEDYILPIEEYKKIKDNFFIDDIPEVIDLLVSLMFTYSFSYSYEKDQVRLTFVDDEGNIVKCFTCNFDEYHYILEKVNNRISKPIYEEVR